MAPADPMPRRRLQAPIGLALAGAIVGGWLALHLFAMFGFRFSATSWPWGLPIAAAICWLSVGMFIVAHDAMHGSLAPGWPRLNAAVGTVVLFAYAGFGWRKLRHAHFAHHRAPASADDPDYDAANAGIAWRWYATFLRRYFGWRSLLFVGGVVALYWLAGVPMENIVLLYGLPAIASSVQLFYFGTFRPHRDDHRAEAFADRHNARSERFGPVLSLLTCFHFGYHHEHHLHPGTPWWALPATRRETTEELA